MSSIVHRTLRRLAAGPLTLLPALLLVASAPPASADDRGTLLEVRAERLANDGECADAIALLSSAPEPARSSAPLLRLKGKCQIEVARYPAAIVSLEAAKAADSSLEDVDLMLGIARYHDEDFAGATAALDAARLGATSRQAELELYSGLLLLRAGKAREAALSLERARRLDAEAVEPVASYYAALAWHSERETDRAQAALERTRQNDPDGPWTRQATDALRTQGGEVPWWVVLTLGAEYDSNVIVRAEEQRNAGDKDDFRAVAAVSGGIRLLESENWSGGVIGSYSGSAHFDQTRYDRHAPSAGAWLDRRLGDNDLLRFRYDFGYEWIDYDPFVATHQKRISLLHDWGTPGTSELFVRGQHNDFQYRLADLQDDTGCAPNTACGLDGRNEHNYRDRDGDGIDAGIEHRVPFSEIGATLRGGYAFSRYWADGQEWDADTHRVHLGASALLPFDVLLDAEGSFARSYFQHASSYPLSVSQAATAFIAGNAPILSSKDREDDIWVATASLEKPITDELSISARYSYIDANSNSEFFEYHRHVVGAYLTVRLP